MSEGLTDLDFGGRDGDRAWVYARYAMGTPVSAIAAEAGISTSEVYVLMREKPEQYEETKQKREDFTGLRLQRSLSLIDAKMLHDLELIAIDDNTDPEMLETLDKLAKNIANRLALHEGKATSIMRLEDKILTPADLQAKLDAMKEAGNGLAID